MAAFEYNITLHSSETVSQVAYFCNEKGECGISSIPDKQLMAFRDILNQKGREGWEAVQLIGGKDGIMAVWKRTVR